MNYTTSFRKESGKIIDQEHFKKLLLDLQDGEYHVIIENITDSTPENFRKMYFALLGQVSKYTGTDKNELHEEVKEANDIFTTQGFSVEEWVQHIRFMRDFYYQKLNIIL